MPDYNNETVIALAPPFEMLLIYCHLVLIIVILYLIAF
ncbi:hypothetical protein CRENPOLYSF2_950003 [Crenothrix polyspora]|uniref:Uncharacterized protein n=1 Tax=Crenothrix polyspora TaxID=360316 RepID=A0A1R4HJ54_9GAMM|nr:hypothetical protein CRENPOLYSF2_950003 [Crenothrix polyspora]